MKKCLFDGVFGGMNCHSNNHHSHSDGASHRHVHGNHYHHHHNNHHHYHAIHLFNEMVGPKALQVAHVMGQMQCPDLSHAQLQVIRAEVAILCANKNYNHSVKHALHHFYHELGIQHAALQNPYVVFGPIVAQKIKHLKLDLCKMKSQLVNRIDSISQTRLFDEAFHLAFSHIARMINDLHASDLTVKRLEHIKREVEMVQYKIHECKDHFYNHIGGVGKHIDASVVGMAEGLKMQWHKVKEMLHQRELEIARA